MTSFWTRDIVVAYVHGLHILVEGLASTQKRPRKVVGAGAAKTRLDIARKNQPIVHTGIIAEQLIQGIGACMPPLRRVMADFAWRTNAVRKFPSAKGADTTHCTAVPKDVAAYKLLLRFRGHATFWTIKHRLYSNAVEMTQGGVFRPRPFVSHNARYESRTQGGGSRRRKGESIPRRL